MLRALPLVLLLAVAWGGAAPGASAQTARGVALPAVGAMLEEGDALHARHRPRDALDAFQRILARDSANYPALWRAAREAVALGMLTGDDEARRTFYAEAERHARRAVEVRPDAIEGHHWLSVAYGRRAEDEGPRTKVDLAERIRDEALFVLARDSLHAGAHNVLGQWNAEVMRLNGVTRFVARKLLGADTFDRASWEAAEAHLRRAVELEPRVLIHRLALARVLLDRGRGEEAREHLREVLERPALDPVDPLLKQQAQELLRGL